MKHILITLAPLLFATASFLQAQELSKDEKKEWKNKMKSMSIEEFKSTVEEKEMLESELTEREETIAQLEAEKAQLNAEVEDYKAAALEAEEKLEAMQEQTMASDPQEEPAGGGASYDSYSNTGTSSGVVFKVQVGAFKNFDIRKYFNNHENFSGEVTSEGIMKYTLGQFDDYWEADKFKKYLREMGVEGAWVVSYKDGQRVPIKDVLEGAI